jgi:hypothetical protein
MTKQELIRLLQQEFYLSVDVDTEKTYGYGSDTHYVTRVKVKLVDHDTGEAVLTGESY